MNKITIERIEAFKPCQDRLNHFKTHYSGFSGSLEEFLSLDQITYNDKIWVTTRLMTHNQKFRFAVACDESVYELYSAKYPNDTRVRELLDFMSQIKDVETITEETMTKLLDLRRAADAAAYAADADAAYAAADVAYEHQQNLNLQIAYMILNEEC